MLSCLVLLFVCFVGVCLMFCCGWCLFVFLSLFCVLLLFVDRCEVCVVCCMIVGCCWLSVVAGCVVRTHSVFTIDSYLFLGVRVCV